MVIGIVLATITVVWVILKSEQVLIWAFTSLLLALALNPAVERFQRLGVRRRGAAAALVYLVVTAFIAGIAALVIPTLVDQVSQFIDAVPGYVQQLTAGRGPLGFLERDYHVVERVREAVSKSGGSTAASLAGGASTALDVTRSVVTFVAAVVTITFLTLFMLLEGPAWIQRGISMLPERMQPTWREIADDIYHLVGRYVNGNLLISLIAGTSTTIVLLALGVPFALALGLIVAILDLIPLAGATLGAIVVTLVALSHSVTAAIIVLVFYIVYQQVENHLLQPLIYGRTVRLSPLAILLSVLIGSQVAGVIGALAAIPVGGTIQILLDHWQRSRRPPDEPLPPPEPAGKLKDRPREEAAVAQS
ncbi:MAG TPA: AI-2E family transporter [Solirubrobacteraceae bacterium]|nr:AI-2E family transporter [Solirubrobacteraceae bacterium]